MASYRRYAIFMVPPEGAFAEAGSAWLGWDSLSGADLPAPNRKLTKTPRKYGFHGTIKPPFRLAEGEDADGLAAAARSLSKSLAPVALERLSIARIGGFLAFTPDGGTGALAEMAAQVVKGLDAFRAPLTEDEMARRRRAKLTARQEEHLADWGYPYVLDEFRFHMTLTGFVPDALRKDARAEAAAFFEGAVPEPYVIDHLCLMGENAETGLFHVLERLPLGGRAGPN